MNDQNSIASVVCVVCVGTDQIALVDVKAFFLVKMRLKLSINFSDKSWNIV